MRHTFNDIPGKPEVYLDHQVEEPYKAPGIASSITRPGKPGETLNTIFSQTVDNPFSAISATRPRLAARLLLSLSLSLALFHPSVPLQQPIQSQIGPPGLIGVVEIGPVAASSTLPPPPFNSSSPPCNLRRLIFDPKESFGRSTFRTPSTVYEVDPVNP